VAVYQQKAKERIRRSLRKFRPIAAKALQNAVNEADTRVLVNALLSEALGWDPFAEITGEHLIRGQYCDFAIKQDAGMFAIIEVKAANIPLSPKHLYQAAGYAASEGVDWVMLTNGADWQVYRVLFEKPVTQDLVFEVSLLDEETTPAQKTELLYLVSKEAQRAGELDAYYQKKAALCGANIAKALLSQKVLSALRSEMRRLHGHNVSPQELATLLVQDVFRPDVQGNDTARLILRAAAQKKANGSNRTSGAQKSAVSVETHLAKADPTLRPCVDDFFAFARSLGPDVTVKPMPSYIAFRTERNVCCMDVYGDHFFVTLDLDPAEAAGCSFARDVSKIGHQGTGALQLRVETAEQAASTKELVRRAYSSTVAS
jgi:predicted type IV restriction endonuclease/predicted transport protein